MHRKKNSLPVHWCVVAMYVCVALAILAFAGGLLSGFTHSTVQVAHRPWSVSDLCGITFWAMMILFVIAASRVRKLSPLKPDISSDWPTENIRRE